MIRKYFKFTGTVKSLLLNINEADMVFSFNADFKGKESNKLAWNEPKMNDHIRLTVFNNDRGGDKHGGHLVPVNAYLAKDDRAIWHIMSKQSLDRVLRQQKAQ